MTKICSYKQNFVDFTAYQDPKLDYLMPKFVSSFDFK